MFVTVLVFVVVSPAISVRMDCFVRGFVSDSSVVSLFVSFFVLADNGVKVYVYRDVLVSV